MKFEHLELEAWQEKEIRQRTATGTDDTMADKSGSAICALIAGVLERTATFIRKMDVEASESTEAGIALDIVDAHDYWADYDNLANLFKLISGTSEEALIVSDILRDNGLYELYDNVRTELLKTAFKRLREIKLDWIL